MIFNVNSFSKKCSGISKSNLICNGKFKESSSSHDDSLDDLLRRKKELEQQLRILNEEWEHLKRIHSELTSSTRGKIDFEFDKLTASIIPGRLMPPKPAPSEFDPKSKEGNANDKVKLEVEETNVGKEKLDEEETKGFLSNLSFILMIFPLP